jgi:hypothetical protein
VPSDASNNASATIEFGRQKRSSHIISCSNSACRSLYDARAFDWAASDPGAWQKESLPAIDQEATRSEPNPMALHHQAAPLVELWHCAA